MRLCVYVCVGWGSGEWGSGVRVYLLFVFRFESPNEKGLTDN